MLGKELTEQLARLKVKIPYDEDIFQNEAQYELVLKDLLTDSKAIMFETLYPFDDDLNLYATPIPPKYYNWQLRCCVELYNMADKQGLVNYSENSLSWSKLVDGLSTFLMSKLTPKIGTVKSKGSD